MSNDSRAFKAKYVMEFKGVSRGSKADITAQEEIIAKLLKDLQGTFNWAYKTLKVRITKI